MADKVQYDRGFFATVQARAKSTTPYIDVDHVRALVLEPSEANAGQLSAVLKAARVGAAVVINDAAEAPALLATPGPGADVAIVDLRKGGAGAAAAEALRRTVGIPMLLLVESFSPDMLDLAYRLKPATLVPPPVDGVTVARYLAQTAKKPAQS